MPRLDWRLWFLPLRLSRLINSAIKDGVEYSAIHQALQQQQQAHNQTANPSIPSVYPPWWNTFLVRICRRQREVLQLLGPQLNIDLSKAPCPRGLRVSLYDYRFTPPKGSPIYAPFFPQGQRQLTQHDLLEIEKELQNWEIGTWWMRRRHQIIDLLAIRSSPSSSSYE
ncbi:lipase maturation [Cystoisospora suis]|uniref:Lipase maturation n=1 Tax=Cystoisospora suis TaxID=483139 RepID=A0A2C6KEW5_9APIC|nr:lipase maturation [Cystoisospora suis]